MILVLSDSNLNRHQQAVRKPCQKWQEQSAMIFWHLQCKQLRQGPDPPAQTQNKSWPLGCSTAELHCKDKGGGEATAKIIASPITNSTSRDMHGVRDECELGASTELRGPEAFTLDAELRKQHPRVAKRGVLPAPAKGSLDNTFSGSLTMRGPAWGQLDAAQTFQLSSCLQWPWNNTCRQKGR